MKGLYFGYWFQTEENRILASIKFEATVKTKLIENKKVNDLLRNLGLIASSQIKVIKSQISARTIKILFEDRSKDPYKVLKLILEFQKELYKILLEG